MSSELVTRRKMMGLLGASGALAAYGNTSASSKTAVPDDQTGSAAPAATAAPTTGSEESTMPGRAGTLIRVEGLIVYQVFGKPRQANSKIYDVSAVDALLVDSGENDEPKLHLHVPTIGIPRDIIHAHAKGAVAVDRTHAYWSLKGRKVTIAPATSIAAEPMDLTPPTLEESLPDDNEWRSMAWLADLESLYPDYTFARKNYKAIVRFAQGIEFEPKKINYGLSDRPNGKWFLTREKDSIEGKSQGYEQLPARAFKHSTHAFVAEYGVTITGLKGGPLTLPLSGLDSPYAIKIQHVPLRAGDQAELVEGKDARAYADLLEPKKGARVSSDIKPPKRWFPSDKDENTGKSIAMSPTPKGAEGERTSGCGCCPEFLVLDLSGEVPSL